MASPERISIAVYGTKYYLEIDVSKADCNKEKAHCHVTNGRSRIAQVWLDSCSFESIPSEISHNDCRRILDYVENNRYELKCVYEYNRINGAD